MEHGTHHVYSSSVNEQLVSSKKNCDIDSHLEGDDAELFYSPSPRNDLLVKDLEPRLSQIFCYWFLLHCVSVCLGRLAAMSRFVEHNLTSMGMDVCLQGRENKRGGLQQLETTPGRQLGMKAGFGKRSEKETSRWASVHDALHLVEATTNVEMAFVSKNSLAFRDAHASNEAQTMPFKAIQSSPLVDHKLLGLEESKKKTSSGIVMSGAATGRLASAQQQQPAAGNVVNATGTGSHVRPGTDAEAYDCDSPSSFDFSKDGVYQAAMGSVPKLHTPSKWDDAEKWLSASDQTPAGSGSKAAGSKSRSGPLQAHVVANEGGVKMSKKALFSNPGAIAAGRPQTHF
jgi:co-chaperonin GroES (HSP10)